MVKTYVMPFVFGLTFVLSFGQNDSINKLRRSNQTLPVATFKTVSDTSKRGVNPVNGYDLDKLYALEIAFADNFTQSRSEVETYAKENNLPIRYTLADGSIAEMRRISEEGTPVYYRTFNDDAAISTRANYLNTGGGLGLDLNGDNLTAHVWDGGHARVSHQEYDGSGGTNRVTLMDTSSEGGTQLNFHAAHVTGTICASGVQPQAKGMAWECNVRGYMWNNDVAEAISQAGVTGINQNYGMLVSNHSYGYGASSIPDSWFGQYGSDARDWDLVMNSAPYYLMLVAAGNDGTDNTSNGAPLANNAAFDKLSGHATAKNNLVVANGTDANIDGSGNLISISRVTSSSEGPTDDYRIKPDIMGNGYQLYSTYETTNTAYGTISGTSMATPNVTGTLLLLQEHYYNLHGTYMRAASLKGLVLHTADDAGGLVGPDAEFGWGLVNAKKAAETLTDAAALSGNSIVEELTLNPGQTYQITVQSNGVDPLMASISWNDPAHAIISGTNNSTPALVNDLDLRLSNGSTYFPWRLTGVNSNSQGGDNDVDPYERIDISGASGTYTLTVTHEGSLNGNNPQDYTLIVTGVVVATTPMVSFGTTSDTIIEDSNCSFTDITIPVNIALGPSQNADVSFSINGSSTATEGLDYELLTTSVSFPTGSTNSQNMVIRVFHDGLVEGDETVLINMSVNANGGNAQADPNANIFELTIFNDDNPPPVTQITEIMNYNMDDTSGWLVADRDLDGNNWLGLQGLTWTGISGLFMGSETNLSILGGTGKANANNYFISPQITLSNNTTNVQFSYGVGGYQTKEHYATYWTTDISSYAAIDSSSMLLEERDSPTNNSEIRTINVSSIAGQTGYFIIRHFNSLSNNGILLFDNFVVTVTEETPVQTAVNTGNPAEMLLNDGGDYTVLDPASDKIMMGISNNDAFDYGCVSFAVSRSGVGSQPYNGSSLPYHVMDKTFTITAANSPASGDVTLTFYFEEAEIAGWESATGLSRNNLVINRGDATSVFETSTATIGAFGPHVTVTANFNELAGTYYFGPSEAFNLCAGVAKVWNGSAWSPAGAPTDVNAVVINGNYNTATSGAISACTLNVSAGNTLTVNPANAVVVQGNIVVDGALVVEHQANVVQLDDNASVINNGTIHVEVTTPVLQPRDFMIMGSPMTGETREDVFASSFLVLNFNPQNFLPHPDVPEGGTNFADDDGNFYSIYLNGPIHPGEGYVVRPQSGYGDPYVGPFDFDFNTGTLNNGVVTYTNYNNGPLANPEGTPNVVANPYPSAINANTFMAVNGINELYFWEHLTPPGAPLSNSNLRFDMEDISMYNGTMGVPAGNDPGNLLGTAPNEFIATAQGFGIRTTGIAGTTGTITFNNSMRLDSGNTTLTSPELAIDKMLIEVRENTYGYGSFTGIAFKEGATDLFDPGMDSNRLATTVSLFSHLSEGDKQLGIQTRSPFESGVKVSLGFESQIEEELSYTLSINEISGIHLEEATVYLVDNDSMEIHNLSEQDYTFYSKEGFYANRFTLLFEGRPLETTDYSLNQISVYPNPTTGTLNIVSPNITIETVHIIDMQGREVGNYEVFSNTTNISMERLGASVYFVEIVSSEGIVTKKVIKQ